MKNNSDSQNKSSNVFGILKEYIFFVILLTFLTIATSGLSLVIPKIIASAMDSFDNPDFNLTLIVSKAAVIIAGIFVISNIQNILQSFIAEKVARDYRKKIMKKISGQNYAYIQEKTSAKLLTNLTSDVNSIKFFIVNVFPQIVSSVFLFISAAILLFSTSKKLTLIVFSIIPFIAVLLFSILRKIRKLFTKNQENIDKLNKTISENIFAVPLIRLLNSQNQEVLKFNDVNTESRDIGINIVSLFANLIPTMSLLIGVIMIIIVAIGGKAIMGGSMTIGDLTAFTNYIMVLVFPMIMIGFISNMLAQAEASYSRIKVILDSADPEEWGSNVFNFSNSINVFNVNLKLNNKNILKDISFSIKKGSKVAIIGPTAAGKTQLFYLLSGLIKPTSGDIKFDSIDIFDYDKDSFYKSIGFVFQDSVIFNLSLRENIAFGNNIDKQSLDKAIKTAELSDFIDSLDDGLDTIITERGSNLSGGQKQRIMLARALAINPKILFLDDFTARVDNKTEQKIIANLRENYPDITLISITQKINPIKDYDDVILLMEGELLISGKHDELLSKSPEYAQIYQSQNSMNNYEIHA